MGESFERTSQTHSFASEPRRGEDLLIRALRSQNLWLVLTYLGLILLMARTYA